MTLATDKKNRRSQKKWLVALLRERSSAGKTLTQVELQDLAEVQLGHPFPKYTARMSEIRDDLFPDEALFAEYVGEEVWAYHIGPMTTAAREKYLENRGGRMISLLSVTYDEFQFIINEAADVDASDWSTPKLREFAQDVEAHLVGGCNLGEAVRSAL